MGKIKMPVVSFLVVLVMVVALTLVASAFYPPAIYRCTVYMDGGRAGAGLTVKAYVGTETAPRDGAEAVTDKNGIAIMKVPIITAADLAPSPKTLSFTVDNVAASVPPQPTVVNWDLPYGLDEDDAAVNQWKYPEDAEQVTLADVEDTMPDDFSVIWHYADTTVGWQWFTPGWPESTLDTLEAGKYYIGVALSACQWEIPQD